MQDTENSIGTQEAQNLILTLINPGKFKKVLRFITNVLEFGEEKK